MPEERDNTFSVMAITLVITLVVILVSLLVLWSLTKDAYLSAYFELEAFFDVQNVAASTDLAAFVFGTHALSLGGTLSVIAVVLVDNLSRILVVSFILAAVIDFLQYANVEGFVNEIRARSLSDHIIIGEYNSITESLVKKLKAAGTRYIVIVAKRSKSGELSDNKIPNIVGDFLEPEVLKRAGVGRARAVAFLSDDDTDNVMGALAVRNLNASVKIACRLEDEHVRRKAHTIGVDIAVIPEHLAGLEMGEYLARECGA